MSGYQGNIVIKNPATPNGPAENGTAPGIWKLNEALTFVKQGIWPTQGVKGRDPYFSYVTMLLSTTSLNGAQNNTFLDSSTNNFTITRVGNPTQGSVNPYGANWSNYFDGSGDDIYLNGQSAFAFGTGDFTIEGWLFYQPTGTLEIFIDWRPYLTTGAYPILYLDASGNLIYDVNGTRITGGPVTANTWNHFALARSGTSTKLFINGTQSGSTYSDSNNYLVGSLRPVIGTSGYNPPDFYYKGYLSNIRMVKGTAVYTSNFTPPTSALTAISGTSLLTCQSNRFRDASTNNFTITRDGNTSVTVFSPFSPSAAYSTANGGSSYLPGGANYLTAASNAAFGFGSGDFTVEFWFYYAGGALPSDARYISFGGTSGCLNITQRSGGIGIVNEAVAHILITSTNFDVGAWNHLAFTRSGSTLRLFKNGVQFGTTTSSAGNSTGEFYLFGAGLTGYFSSVRVVKGTALYTSNFTPNTTPLTAISGTSILLNGTNAGAYDATAINDMETVGNAQVSTAVSKFGGSSMAFDGTGDYVVIPSSNEIALGSGDFTIEFWVYLNSNSIVQLIYDQRSGQGAYPAIYMPNASIRYYVNSADRIIGANLNTATWYHIAICRSGTSTRMFINGTQSGSTYTDTTNYLAAPLFVGADKGPSSFMNGYIDDLRVTKGVARYTTTFIPPTQAFINY